MVRVQPPRKHLVPEAPQRTHGGDRIHRLALAAGEDDGRLAPRRPGASEGRVRPDPGLVEEEDRGPAPMNLTNYSSRLISHSC